MNSQLIKPEWQDEERYKEMLVWFDNLPPLVKKVMLTYFNPLSNCYRLKSGNKGHYGIYSLYEEDDNKISVKIFHYEDSYLPGIGVFGISPSDLIKCGC